MQFLATAEEMRQADRLATRKLRVPGLVLMENAGRAFVDALEEHSGQVRGKRVTVVCGKGNNGGDGFVIARHLVLRGAKVVVVILARRNHIKDDAKTNYAALSSLSGLKETGLSQQWVSSLKQFSRLPAPHIIVDAIFGTGFSGAVKGIAMDAIRWINRQSCFVASVDIPSGVDASTGNVGNIAVKADLTVTMGLAKIGQYVGEGRECSGEIRVVDIGVPDVAYKRYKEYARVQPADVVLPARARNIHKYDAGKVLVIAGSRAYTGAPVLAALAAMRTGAGMVTLIIPKSIHGILARKLTEVILVPVAETAGGSIAKSAIAEILKRSDSADAVVIGPGLSLEVETQQVVRSVVAKIKRPLIVDADALSAFSGHGGLLRKRKSATILTPHAGEFARLTGVSAHHVERQRASIAVKWSRTLRSMIVLKGSPTVTASMEGRAYLNSTGNPGMATAGAGDVLCGVIAALIAGGLEPVQAAYSGVYIHGRAGDIAARQLGERSLMATDILRRLPASLLHLEDVAR